MLGNYLKANKGTIMKDNENSSIISVPGITGIIVALIGLSLVILGIKLITLGGSWYYAIAGLGMIISGWLLIKRKYEGICVYGVVFLGTIIWAVAEVGFDGWKLMPRLFAPAILGIWLCLPIITNRLYEMPNKRYMLRMNGWFGATFCAFIAVMVIVLGYMTTNMRFQQSEQLPDVKTLIGTDSQVSDGDWRYYGRTANADRFSPLNQITPQNISKLKVAWTYRTGDLAKKVDTEKGREYSFEATPTKVGDNIYFCTPHERVISLNATTGTKNWEFDPKSDTTQDIFHACRGVAYYETTADKSCPRKIISPTGDPRIVGLNADTGKPCENFGEHGFCQSD